MSWISDGAEHGYVQALHQIAERTGADAFKFPAVQQHQRDDSMKRELVYSHQHGRARRADGRSSVADQMAGGDLRPRRGELERLRIAGRDNGCNVVWRQAENTRVRGGSAGTISERSSSETRQ